jgi:hypothetical protein
MRICNSTKHGQHRLSSSLAPMTEKSKLEIIIDEEKTKNYLLVLVMSGLQKPKFFLFI